MLYIIQYFMLCYVMYIHICIQTNSLDGLPRVLDCFGFQADDAMVGRRNHAHKHIKMRGSLKSYTVPVVVCSKLVQLKLKESKSTISRE